MEMGVGVRVEWRVCVSASGRADGGGGARNEVERMIEVEGEVETIKERERENNESIRETLAKDMFQQTGTTNKANKSKPKTPHTHADTPTPQHIPSPAGGASSSAQQAPPRSVRPPPSGVARRPR